jgi:hypothetical protein
MSREVHVRFWESARVKVPRATQLLKMEVYRCTRFPLIILKKIISFR